MNETNSPDRTTQTYHIQDRGFGSFLFRTWDFSVWPTAIRFVLRRPQGLLRRKTLQSPCPDHRECRTLEDFPISLKTRVKDLFNLAARY